MGRKKIFRTSHHPYHVYNRVISKDFYPPRLMNEIWQIYCDAACVVTWAYGARIHAMLLMSNHFHMLISTPDENLDQIMQYFQREISKQIVRYEENERYRFQSRYKSKVITDPRYFRDAYKYIFTNPQDIEPLSPCSNYRFSTFAAQCGHYPLLCPIYENDPYSTLMPQDICDREAWVNLM